MGAQKCSQQTPKATLLVGQTNFFNNQTQQSQSVMLNLDLPISFFTYEQTLFNLSNLELEQQTFGSNMYKNTVINIGLVRLSP